MPKRTHHDIILSSTFKELEKHRDVVIEAILELELFPQAMELDAALPVGIVEASFDKVERADAYVGIIGYRYGQIPSENNPQRLSITELEYNEARRRKLPICMFVMSADHPVPRSAITQETGEQQRSLEAFRKRVTEIKAVFDSVEDLKSKALLSIAVLRDQLDAAQPGKPKRPTGPKDLVAMPAYPESNPFQGRKKELQTLNDWAVDPQEPVMVLEAIGGMGKSYLSWRWVNVQARSIRPDLNGIFWYSFYERGGDMRDFCAHALAYVSGDPVENLREKKTLALLDALVPYLSEKPWLLILDGLERVLVAYNRYDAAHIRDEEVDEFQQTTSGKKRPVDCIRPSDTELLQTLATASPSKFLLSSRLMPGALLNNLGMERPGVAHVRLTGLDPTDAEALLTAAGIKGDSAAIRRYLDRNFGCHPLIVGIIGGLVRNYPPAPGDFDQWVADDLGGGSVNLAEMDVVAKRNDILKIAFEGLSQDTRTLLARIGLVSQSVDYKTLKEFSPRRPDEKWLREALHDLQLRGLLQLDHAAKAYDLHPVIRGYSVSSVPAGQRENVAQRLIDHFDTLPHPPWDDAKTIGELQNALHVVRSYLHLGRFVEATSTLLMLSTSLIFNLEAYEEYLALLSPVFSDGWERPAPLLKVEDLVIAWNDVAVCLGYSGRAREALKISESILLDYAKLDWPDAVAVGLRSLGRYLHDLGHLYSQERVAKLAEAAAASLGDDDGKRAYVQLGIMSWATVRGDFNNAEGAASRFVAVPRPTNRSIYRPGDYECCLVRLRLFTTQLDDALLDEAQRAAEGGTNRRQVRELHAWRGEWHLSTGRWAEAASAFEENIRMTREVNLSAASSEARLALAQAKIGRTQSARETADRLSQLEDPPHLNLAELYLALNDVEATRRHIPPAYKRAWADGEPYSFWWELKRCRKVLQTLGDPEPQLPKFDPANFPPLPYEAKVRDYIEKKRAEKSAQ